MDKLTLKPIFFSLIVYSSYQSNHLLTPNNSTTNHKSNNPIPIIVSLFYRTQLFESFSINIHPGPYNFTVENLLKPAWLFTDPLKPIINPSSTYNFYPLPKYFSIITLLFNDCKTINVFISSFLSFTFILFWNLLRLGCFFIIEFPW